MSTQAETVSNQYGTLQYKTLESACHAFIAKEFPGIAGSIARKSLAAAFCGMVRQFHPEISHVAVGQLVWIAAGKDAKGSYGAKIEDTPLVSVVLPITTPAEIAALAKGEIGIRQARNETFIRLCDEAFRQGGVLTLADVAVLTKTSPSTVSKHIRRYEADTGKTVPRRGTIHDMGPTLTHKALIIPKLFLEKKSFQQVCRETCHSPEAVHRYYAAFKGVLTCVVNGLSEFDITIATRMSPGLVRQYLKIIDDFTAKGCFPKDLVTHQTRIESDYEKHLKDQIPVKP
jgi:Protein of unknown function (DUF1670)